MELTALCAYLSHRKNFHFSLSKQGYYFSISISRSLSLRLQLEKVFPEISCENTNFKFGPVVGFLYTACLLALGNLFLTWHHSLFKARKDKEYEL